MSIEPVGSVMTYQASTQAPRPVEKPAAREAADMDVAAASVEKPDSNTVVIKDTQQSDPQKDQREGKDKGDPQQPKELSQQQQGQEAVKKMLDKLEKEIDKNTEAVFGVHEKTKRVTIKIVDKDTKDVLKEFPPEKTLDMIAKVWELAGLFMDEKR